MLLVFYFVNFLVLEGVENCQIACFSIPTNPTMLTGILIFEHNSFYRDPIKLIKEVVEM